MKRLESIKASKFALNSMEMKGLTGGVDTSLKYESTNHAGGCQTEDVSVVDICTPVYC